MKRHDIIEIKAERMIYQGICLSELEGKKVFLENCITGDIVKARVRKIKQDYLEAVAVEVVIPSPLRTKAECRHFGVCGGCKIQDMDYSAQALAKEEIVRDIFKRIGKTDFPVSAIIPSEEKFFYRNKMEYSFSSKRWLLADAEYSEKEKAFALGLHIPNRFDKILNLDECFLQSDFSNKARTIIGDFLFDKDASIFSLENRTGLLKCLIIRDAKNTNEKMINLVTTYFDEALMNELSEIIKEKIPECTSFVNNISDKNLSSTIGFEVRTIFGSSLLKEKMINKNFEIGSNSFFQTNTKQAERMFEFVKAELSGSGQDILVDLFSGVGVIGILMSDLFRRVIGIEQNLEAVSFAKRNAYINNTENIEFYSGDLNTGFNADILGKYEDLTVIVDPPRTGLHEKTIKKLLELKPKTLVYISCNPTTQARDILSFLPQYSIKKLQPFDLFPNTYHIENIAVMKIV